MEKWLDNTKISSWERCPREFFLRHCLHLTKEDRGSVATEFGKAFHLACELVFTGTPLESALNEAVRTFKESLLSLMESAEADSLYEDGRSDPDTLLRSLHYFFTSGAGSELLGVLKHSQTELQLTYSDPEIGWDLLARIDLLGETHSGTVLLVDFKTTGWNLRSWGAKILTDTQLQTYALVVTSVTSRKVDAGAYAVLQVQRRRLRSGAFSPNISLDSALFPLALTEDHLQRAKDRFKQTAKALEQAWESRSFPCVWSSCSRMNGVCQFHPLCERFWKAELSKEEEQIREVAFSLGFVEQRWDPFDVGGGK